MTPEKSELELLRDTLVEVRHAQPKCGRGACERVATFFRNDEDRCDEHRDTDGRGAEYCELPIARVARRLGW